jgi:hypothetical protein
MERFKKITYQTFFAAAANLVGGNVPVGACASVVSSFVVVPGGNGCVCGVTA